MRSSSVAILIWVAMTLAVGLLTSIGWPGFVIGAVLGLSLWVMLFFGSYATPDRGFPSARVHATAAAMAVVLGYVLVRLGDGNPAMWVPGVIIAGAVLPAAAYTRSKSPHVP